MYKQYIRILIPLLIVGGYLVNTWIRFFSGAYIPNVRHYIALVLFIALIALFIRNVKKLILFTGLYLLIATLNGLTLTTSTLDSVSFSGLVLPIFSPLGFGILVVYCIVNFNFLVNYYLDYREEKSKKAKNS